MPTKDTLDCLLARNPLCGYLKLHGRFCFRLGCDEDATHHVNTGAVCGNVCEKCGKKLGVVQVGIYVPETAHEHILSTRA